MTDMATNAKALDWRDFKVVRFNGQKDTKRWTGEDYSQATLAEIFAFTPTKRPKEGSPAFIPSEHNDYDARVHARQKEVGSYVALVGDIDEGDHSLEWVCDLVEKISGGSAWFIHSSSNSRPGNMRWRIIFPLANPVGFLDWNDAQLAFFAIMERQGAVMDKAMARAGQPVYLPNIPSTYKDGTPLRDGDGKPLYYETMVCDDGRPGLDIQSGTIAKAIGGIQKMRAQKEIEDQKRRVEALKNKKPQSSDMPADGVNIVADFNSAHSIESMLISYGYSQSPRNADDWRSPYQEGETYATRVMGDKWVSLSQSDVNSGLGASCEAGCWGDAYDLYAHYTHKNDHKAAWRELYRERDIAKGNVISGPWEAPPPLSEDDLLWEPVADWEYMDDGNILDNASNRPIKATPFTWRPESEIPKREWLYGNHLLRKFLSVDVAAGGVGKSSLKIGEALSIASGVDFYAKKIHQGPHTVWLYNLEDPAEETERRIHATAKKFNLTPDDLGGRLYADSGRDQPCVIAEETATGIRIATPIVESIVSEIMERGIDILVIDPFVSSHAVSENDNNKIDVVAKTWAAIADRCNCSINLVHHIRKQNGTEATAESARGAVALIGAARSVMVFNRMSKDEASGFGIPEEETRFYFRVDNDKANLAPPGKADWYRMNNVDLDNGDSVGVACAWTAPDLFDGISTDDLRAVKSKIADGKWRESEQSPDWAGRAIAECLDMDAKKDRGRIKSILKTWISNGALSVVEGVDSKSNVRKFIVVGIRDSAE